MSEMVGHSACGAEHGLISVDQALALIQQRTQPLPSKSIALNSALHHYLAEHVYSTVDLPLFAQSAVDGYAIHATAEIEAGSIFEVIGEVRAGQQLNTQLGPGQALRIFTGAQIPDGTTSVARQEIVQILQAHQSLHSALNNQSIQITEPLKLHADIRDQAEEVAIGQCLAEKGQWLSVGGIAALSMAGVQQVQVYPDPKLAVLITGDEVAKTAQELTEGKVFDANGPMIQAWFKQRNQAFDIFHIDDTEHALRHRLEHLSENYQLILTTGGISVGDYDFIRPVALDVGFEQIFWKVKQKPGKPIFFAERSSTKQSKCYLLGLAGNPAAVFVGMHMYTTTLIQALQGQTSQGKTSSLPWFSAVLSHRLNPDRRERFLRMFAHFEQAQLVVHNLDKQQSHMLSNLIQSNCLVRIPAGETLQAGQIVYGVFTIP